MNAGVKDDSLIKANIEGSIGRITLNRPAKRNAINTQLAAEFVAACKHLAAQNVKVCILDAEGQVFTAGADISDPGMSEAFNSLYAAMIDAPFVWVACVAKPAIGAGLAMVAAATVVVAGPEMWVSLPEIKTINKFPHGVVEKAKPFVSHRWLMGIAVSGNRSSAEEAVRGGLVTEMAARGEEQAVAQRWAETLAAVDPSIIAEVKKYWLETA